MQSGGTRPPLGSAMRASAAFEHRIRLLVFSLGIGLTGLPAGLHAQSLTSGGLRGTVQTAEGDPVSGAEVTVERSGGGAVASLSTDRNGGFALQLLTPGEFRVL